MKNAHSSRLFSDFNSRDNLPHSIFSVLQISHSELSHFYGSAIFNVISMQIYQGFH